MTRCLPHTQVAYILAMKATFVEMPAFARLRPLYLDDEEYRRLQAILMENPEAGDVIQGAGGLRKMRFADDRRNKGTRGGLRVIYYRWEPGAQFWLYAVFDKDEVSDLTRVQRSALRDALKTELVGRSC